MTSGLVSNVIIGGVGLVSKFFLRLFIRDLKVNNLPALIQAIESRPHNTPLITVSNHTSTIDDPLIFGILPPHILFNAQKMRWALGAEELLFNNLLFRAFFTAGRVLAVRRGHGIMQPNITRAIDLLDTGHWVHVFPEGRCNPDSNQLKDRLRWGVGKLILETKQPPLLVPIIHQGMEHIKPLNTWFPRIRKSLTITIGEPLETINLRNRLLADDKLNVNERRSRATDFVASQMSKYYQNGY